MAILESESPFAADDFGFGVDSNGHLVFGNGDSDLGADYTMNGTTIVNTGDWVHACATRQKSTGAMRLFVNGAVDATGTGSTATLISNTHAYIGQGTDGGVYWDGSIDDLRIYSGVLSNSDIATLAAGTACQTSSSSSSSTASSESSRAQKGGGRRSTTLNDQQSQASSRMSVPSEPSKSSASSLSSRSSSTPPLVSQASSSPVVTNVPGIEVRTCSRVHKWFGGNSSAMNRVNTRIRKWLGFSCK